jgi:AAA15 family ATPase/GTPase
MFTTISCKNYKAFENFSLELKPLTVLLGANSFGKSSILNSILMLTQSFDGIEISDSPLRINGSLVALGEAENIFRDMDENNILSINIKSGEHEGIGHQRLEHILHEYSYIMRSEVFTVEPTSTVDLSIDFFKNSTTEEINKVSTALRNLRTSPFHYSTDRIDKEVGIQILDLFAPSLSLYTAIRYLTQHSNSYLRREPTGFLVSELSRQRHGSY